MKKIFIQLLSPGGETTMYEDIESVEVFGADEKYLLFKVAEKDGIIRKYKTNLKFVILEETYTKKENKEI